MTVLFVYGTLKRGGRNHRRLSGCGFVGEAVTAPRYAVVDLGPYPGLVAGGLAVRGELWAVPAGRLAELDTFEGAPEWYTRGPLTLADGREVAAYFWNGPAAGERLAVWG